MPRARVWLQLLLGWLPVWALYTTLLVVMHGPTPLVRAGAIGVHAVVPAALLGLLVHRLARRVPWPRPFTLRFAALHVVAAPLYALAWAAATSVVEHVVRGTGRIAIGAGLVPFLILGVWIYVMVAGISYAIEATARAARAEATAARSQLAALRAQLHPHFLFNALHTVVQLIPEQPALAQDAAEQVAALLRTTVEEDRDLVTLGDEWSFVARYLAVERIRFGERLRVHPAFDDGAMDVLVPSFALQTLVENAVRHGAAARVGSTDVTIHAECGARALTLRVRDAGTASTAAGAAPAVPVDPLGTAANGTGLERLRERLAALYGDAARLALDRVPPDACEATLVVPRLAASDA